MKYDEALTAWGASKLRALTPGTYENVTVTMDFSEGFSCCGGSNPECWCSLAEAPRAEVVITGFLLAPDLTPTVAGYRQHTIELAEFDFTVVLRELCEAAGGTVES